MSRIDKLDPLLKSSAEIRLAATLRSNVAAAKGDSTRACNELKNVLPKLNADERVNANDRMVSLLCTS